MVCRVPTVGALGEHLAVFLWPDSYPVSDRVAVNVLKRILIEALQIQVTVALVPLQNPLSFQKTGHPLTDDLE